MQDAHTVDEYLHNVEPKKRKILQHIRAHIHAAVPDAVECMSYGMPAFKYKGQPLMYYGAFSNHMSIFPTSGPLEVLKEKLQGYTVSKGTVQFTENHQLPDDLITEMLQLRIAAIG
jgi:uncharacterized protein YdhG (YjbR/CyaY superfamily)